MTIDEMLKNLKYKDEVKSGQLPLSIGIIIGRADNQEKWYNKWQQLKSFEEFFSLIIKNKGVGFDSQI